MDILNLKIKDIVYNIATKWGKIKGNILEQTDLKNALDNKANISDLPDTSSFLTKNGLLATLGNHEDNTITQKGISDAINLKQDILRSGENIKTINNQSIIGNGNIEITNQNEYTTSEQTIGTWINGKSLYRKVLILNNLSTGNKTYNHNISNLDKIIKIEGSFTRRDGILELLPRLDSDVTWTSQILDITNTVLTIGVGNKYTGNYTITEMRLTIYYTKTID